MEVTKIDFNESKVGKGNITLVKNQLGTPGKYFARFERRTINDDTIIARIHEKGVGLDDLMVKEVVGLYKKEVVAALESGESVNIMDLGTLYIRASGSADSKESAVALMTLRPAFTPSKLTVDAVASVRIKGAAISAPDPRIESVVDLYTGKSCLWADEDDGADGGTGEPLCLSAGRTARVKGSRLKVAGENGGLFFCPVGEDGKAVGDRSLYVQVEPDKILRNKSGELEFYIPDNLEEGRMYRLLVRSNYRGSPGRSLSAYREAISGRLTVGQS